MNRLQIANEVSLAIDGIRAQESSTSEKVLVNFFNKSWHTYYGVGVSHINSNESKARRMVSMFTKKSSELSKQIESEFINRCRNMYIEDPEYYGYMFDKEDPAEYENADNPGLQLKLYKDIPTLSLTNIDVYENKSNGKWYVVISGDYTFDDEHGWSLSFEDGKRIFWHPKNTKYIAGESSPDCFTK